MRIGQSAKFFPVGVGKMGNLPSKSARFVGESVPKVREILRSAHFPPQKVRKMGIFNLHLCNKNRAMENPTARLAKGLIVVSQLDSTTVQPHSSPACIEGGNPARPSCYPFRSY